MSVTGAPDGPPQKVGVAVTDIVTGLYGTIGILAAVQQRHVTGKGQHIDMSLLDCATALLANQNMNYLVSGQSPTRMGNAHPNICPYDVFETADGHIILAVGNDGQFRRCCDVLGLGAIGQDARFVTNQQRVKHRDDLLPILAKAALAWQSGDLLAAFSAQNVPAGPINSVGENLSSAHAKARGLVIAPQGVKGVRTPIVFSDATLTLDRSVPE
jgi:crotonobetainyl-CoA:carnitine CoA-transferase CaiB-like acyl-CoA transferase